MTFLAARARDAQFIVSRTGGEFNVEIKFWNRDLDPSSDDATLTVRGIRFGQAADRSDRDDSQSEMRTVKVSVTKADVASLDELGHMSVAGEIFSIQSAHADDDINWTVKGSRDVVSGLGDAQRYFGG